MTGVNETVAAWGNPGRPAVINLKGRIRDYGPRLEHAPANLVYVGRRMAPRSPTGWDLPASPLRNPHPADKPCRTCDCTVHTRGEVLQLYREHLAQRPDLLALVPALRGRVLACWCPPEPCHGDVLAELANEGGHRAR